MQRASDIVLVQELVNLKEIEPQSVFYLPGGHGILNTRPLPLRFSIFQVVTSGSIVLYATVLACAISRLYPPDPPGEDVDDTFPDDESRSCFLARAEPRRPSVDGAQVNDLQNTRKYEQSTPVIALGALFDSPRS